jgi:peptidyl-tRNA hydrolase, PTH1 family
MRLVVGLGNPGVRYEKTRHNAGFRVVDAVAAKLRIGVETHEKDALTGRGRAGGGTIILAKPLTYMNLSGAAVGKLVRSEIETLDELLVVYDDIDLPLGVIRLREKGSPGTHNGMKSITGVLGSGAFPRLRFGVRGEGWENARDLADYVLEDFTPEEESVVEATVARAAEAILALVHGDMRRVMTRFNRDPEPETGT